MYSNKELANALIILRNECRSHDRCDDCPLRYARYVWEKEFCMFNALQSNSLTDDMIRYLGERDG